MKNRMRKQYQKKLTAALKAVNASIRNDDLWLGRFEVRQGRTNWSEWDDKSGGILFCQIRLVDKATGYYKDYIMDYFGKQCNWHLWQVVNRFITEDCAVWRSGDPYAQVHDYRKTDVPQKLLRGVDNFHLSEEYFDRLGEV